MAKLELRVNGLTGKLCTISAERSWKVAELKAAIEKATSAPKAEQHLFLASTELPDAQRLEECLGAHARGLDTVDLNLVRSPPNRERWFTRVRRSGSGLAHAPKSLRADYELVAAAVQKSPRALRHAAPELRGERELVAEVVARDWTALKYAAPELQEDEALVASALRQDGRALEFASPALRRDRRLVSMAVQQAWVAIRLAAPELQEDPDIVAAAVSAGMPLERVPATLRGNRVVVIAALMNGRSLQLASDDLKGDKDIVAVAVQRCGCSLKHASVELQADRDIVYLAVQQDGRALEYASLELRADRELVSMALRHPAQALQDVVKESLLHEGILTVGPSRSALQFASEELRSDRDLVLLAVSQAGRALHYAAQELRGDRELALVAVQQNWAALKSVAAELRADPEIVAEALKRDGRALRWVPEELRQKFAVQAGLSGPHPGTAACSPKAMRAMNPRASTDEPPSYPLHIPLSDLAMRIEEARDLERMVLVFANGCMDVEIYFSYQMNVQIDCKELINSVFIKKIDTKEDSLADLQAKLAEAMDARGAHMFCKPVHVRMGNTSFDWVNFCGDPFPAEVFSGQRWTAEEAFVRGFIDETQRNNLRDDPARFKEFHVVVTSTFDLDEGSKLLVDSIPFYDELAILVIDPSLEEGT
eukprot:TRINITY_DN23348_c0_g1_i1.p1 TRINITY_DN23348_c0_g1~~TRINITY_DN23348_c0_g1_i1.p1  ORF type:complete len:654 (+),score=156.95 TRINITY_DN23348_c0_g1_i1:99-2060(+)